MNLIRKEHDAPHTAAFEAKGLLLSHTIISNLVMPTSPQVPQQRPQPSVVQQQQRPAHGHTYAQSSPVPNFHLSAEATKPRSQIEAMPPFAASKAFYDSAVRHPVFFTTQLRKPPFPMPQLPTKGWNPVASGYVKESENRVLKTKL